MLTIHGNQSRLCDGVSRREWLRIGGIGLGGLSLPGLLRARAEASTTGRLASAKSVIILFNGGGIPHHESFDPKPDAPREIRGEFGVTNTRTPGLMLGELLPKTAQLTDKMAIIRSMVTGDNSHSTSGYQMLTGVPHVPLNRENAAPGKPNDYPSLAALVSTLRPTRHGLPSAISLPQRLANNNGANPWPGTDGGFLGRRCDPWFLDCDPSQEGFSGPADAANDLSSLTLNSRRSLLSQLNGPLDQIQAAASVRSYDLYQQQAFDLIGGGQARKAFDLSEEPAKLRDQYGRTRYGQSVLLARRLVEAGVSLVQVQWVSADKNKPNGGGWDTHEKHNESVKGWLLPVMDQVYSTLITDLDERGLLDETLVCWVAEFGHTPRFNANGGRDHWGRVFSIALAGGGIQGGIVLGQSDQHAADPIANPVRPADYLATVFHCLGYESETQVHDIEGRPLPISRGRVIHEVLR